MTDHIRDRIARRLDALSEERLYQVLDYVEFLESKYATRAVPTANTFQKFADGIEDRLRAGRMSASTIAETMGLLNRAVGVLNGVAAAGKSVAADLANAAQKVGSAVADATAQAGTVIGTGTSAGASSGTPGDASASGMPAPPPGPSATTNPPPPAPPAQNGGGASGPASGEPRS